MIKFSPAVSTPVQLVQVVQLGRIEQSSKKGLDHILSHFQHFEHFQDSHWPRTVSTKATQGRQVIVTSKDEALAYFKAANYMDCRISAYPYWRASIVSRFAEIKNLIPPDLIMIDLDSCNFFDKRALLAALHQTLQKIKVKLALIPTVIWSGNGFHIYIPIDAVVLENIKEFDHIDQVSTKFLRFAEWYLSSGKSDSSHNTNVSLNNCMLRIPRSLNSKNNVQVKIIKKWDGNRSGINLLIGSFCAYLYDQAKAKANTIANSQSVFTDKITIQWIELLLQTPLQDHRKFAIWRILAPYLLNVKGLPADQANGIIEEWLGKCSELRRLNFYPKSKIRESIKGGAKGYRPIAYEKLKIENNELCERLNGCK